MLGNLIFLSYRRDDSAPFALALKLGLEQHLRATQVFVDTHQIQAADRWEREIVTALRAAKVVVPIIGRGWAGAKRGGKRRIDDPHDWVRRELEIALIEQADAVLPLLVDKATPLQALNLPDSIRELAEIQALQLDLNAWDASLGTLASTLAERFGFARKGSQWQYPKPDPLIAGMDPIPWVKLDEQVRVYLPNWSIEFCDDEERLHHKRVELTRTFEFGSFRDAIAFLNLTAEHAKRVQHHPKLTNIWRTVKVSLTTWDAGHCITPLDLEFARYLDRTHTKC